MCESFGCLPSAAVAELETHGLLVERILFLRAYRDAREAVTHAEKQSDIPAAAITLYTAVQEEVFAMEDSG